MIKGVNGKRKEQKLEETDGRHQASGIRKGRIGEEGNLKGVNGERKRQMEQNQGRNE